MSEFNFIQSQRAYEATFFQFPQILLYGEQYKQLSDSAKLGYMVLRDRLDYSLQNNWIDEQNRVYFIFTNQELHQIFGWGKTKISKVKNELIDAGLLYQVNLGFDPKKKKNLPNRLYLADLEVTAADVYMKHDFSNKTTETLDNSGRSQMGLRQKTAEILDNSGRSQMGLRQKTAETLDNSGRSQMGHNLYNINNLDTNRYNKETAQLDFSTANYSKAQVEKQNQDLVEKADQFLTTDDEDSLPFERETIRLLGLWAKNPQQIRKFIGIILNARKDVQELHQDAHLSFILDDEPELQARITRTLRRYFNALRNDDKKINNYENYLYVTMKNMFESYGSAKLQRAYQQKHNDK